MHCLTERAGDARTGASAFTNGNVKRIRNSTAKIASLRRNKQAESR